jgi:hypothetical protein
MASDFLAEARARVRRRAALQEQDEREMLEADQMEAQRLQDTAEQRRRIRESDARVEQTWDGITRGPFDKVCAGLLTNLYYYSRNEFPPDLPPRVREMYAGEEAREGWCRKCTASLEETLASYNLDPRRRARLTALVEKHIREGRSGPVVIDLTTEPAATEPAAADPYATESD